MHISIFFAWLSILLPISSGHVYDVCVGLDGIIFTPETVTAAVGDTINFHFYSGKHSVAQSTFDAPCAPLTGPDQSIYSGFIVPSGHGPASMMFSMAVNTADTIWLYCSHLGHCAGGMAMVINPGTNQTLDEYKSAATDQAGISPTQTFGGSQIPDSGSCTSTAAASSATTDTVAPTATGASTNAAAASTTFATSPRAVSPTSVGESPTYHDEMMK